MINSFLEGLLLVFIEGQEIKNKFPIAHDSTVELWVLFCLFNIIIF